MAKTDWQMGDAILPDDMNQIGQEINDNASAIAAHVSATTGVHGATSTATPNRIVQRDANGRFKAAAPAASDDVARKAEVDNAINYALPKVARSMNINGPATITDLDLSNVDIVVVQTTAGDVVINNVLANAPGHRCRILKINSTGTLKFKAGGANNWVQGAKDITIGPDDRYAFIELQWLQTGNNVYVNAVADNGQKYARINSEGNVVTKNRVYFSNDDYIEFDDATDTFSFKDDESGAGGPQDSNIKAARIRLTSTNDVSETSTLHAFQIGPDNAENLRVDMNEIIFANNGAMGQGYIIGSRIDVANSLRGQWDGNAQAKMGNTWYDIWHKGNLPESKVVHQIGTNSLSESAPISSWPMGISYMRVEYPSLWLGNVGNVFTVHPTTSTAFQFFIPTVGSDHYYFRSSAGGSWTGWRIMSDYSGTGSPEGVVPAQIGAIYRRLDGSPGSTVYVKRSNSGGNTGWTVIA